MVDLKLDIPKDFYNEEERCGHIVTSKVKEIWAVELDLIAEFERVCKKHQITYYASGGTMLGIVRHKGFIPWDDDVDLMMPRDQYNKLCTIAPSEFKHPYFFQTEYTDCGTLRGHAQLRNSDTTAILTSELNTHTAINQGIFIDIFPLDDVINSEKLLKRQCAKMNFYRFVARALYKIYLAPQPVSRFCAIARVVCLRALVPLKPMNKLKNYFYRKFENTSALYNNKELKVMSLLSFAYGEEVFFNDKKDYEELIDMPFEFLKIPVPSNYEHVLNHRYGNWRKFVKGGSMHGGVIFDTDISYKEYLRNYYKGE
jgi:lipopolysaccharide cholinephosphotransferase